jgi:hypothetical protein
MVIGRGSLLDRPGGNGSKGQKYKESESESPDDDGHMFQLPKQVNTAGEEGVFTGWQGS